MESMQLVSTNSQTDPKEADDLPDWSYKATKYDKPWIREYCSSSFYHDDVRDICQASKFICTANLFNFMGADRRGLTQTGSTQVNFLEEKLFLPESAIFRLNLTSNVKVTDGRRIRYAVLNPPHAQLVDPSSTMLWLSIWNDSLSLPQVNNIYMAFWDIPNALKMLNALRRLVYTSSKGDTIKLSAFYPYVSMTLYTFITDDTFSTTTKSYMLGVLDEECLALYRTHVDPRPIHALNFADQPGPNCAEDVDIVGDRFLDIRTPTLKLLLSATDLEDNLIDFHNLYCHIREVVQPKDQTIFHRNGSLEKFKKCMREAYRRQKDVQDRLLDPITSPCTKPNDVSPSSYLPAARRSVPLKPKLKSPTRTKEDEAYALPKAGSFPPNYTKRPHQKSPVLHQYTTQVSQSGSDYRQDFSSRIPPTDLDGHAPDETPCYAKKDNFNSKKSLEVFQSEESSSGRRPYNEEVVSKDEAEKELPTTGQVKTAPLFAVDNSDKPAAGEPHLNELQADGTDSKRNEEAKDWLSKVEKEITTLTIENQKLEEQIADQRETLLQMSTVAKEDQAPVQNTVEVEPSAGVGKPIQKTAEMSSVQVADTADGDADGSATLEGRAAMAAERKEENTLQARELNVVQGRGHCLTINTKDSVNAVDGLTYVPALKCICVAHYGCPTIWFYSEQGNLLGSFIPRNDLQPTGIVALQKTPNTIVVSSHNGKCLHVLALSKDQEAGNAGGITVVGQEIWKLKFQPIHVNLFKSDMLLVASMSRQSVDILTETGCCVATMHLKSENIDKLYAVVGLGKGLVLSDCNSAESAILWVDRHGKVKRRYTGKDAPGIQGLIHPQGIAAADDDEILVCDQGNSCLHLVSKDGTFKKFLLKPGDGLRRPRRVHYDMSTGKPRIFVAGGEVEKMQIRMYDYEALQIEPDVVDLFEELDEEN